MLEMGYYIAVMALVTYLVRMVPFTAFRRRIKSGFIKSFLAYVPYSVLGAMTVPGILYSTGSVWSAAAGAAAGVIAAFTGRSLLTVAVIACAFAFTVSMIIGAAA